MKLKPDEPKMKQNTALMAPSYANMATKTQRVPNMTPRELPECSMMAPRDSQDDQEKTKCLNIKRRELDGVEMLQIEDIWVQHEAGYHLHGSKICQYGQDSPKRLQDDSKRTSR